MSDPSLPTAKTKPPAAPCRCGEEHIPAGLGGYREFNRARTWHFRWGCGSDRDPAFREERIARYQGRSPSRPQGDR